MLHSGMVSGSLSPGVRTKRCRVGRGVTIELIYAYDLVVGAGCEVSTVRREAHRVDGSQVVAHVAELPWFSEALIVGVVDSFGGPNPDVTIASRSGQSRAIGGDVAAVDLKILLFACDGLFRLVVCCKSVPRASNGIIAASLTTKLFVPNQTYHYG